MSSSATELYDTTGSASRTLKKPVNISNELVYRKRLKQEITHAYRNVRHTFQHDDFVFAVYSCRCVAVINEDEGLRRGCTRRRGMRNGNRASPFPSRLGEGLGIPVRHSGGPLGLTLTLTHNPNPDPRNGGPPEWRTPGMGAGTARTGLGVVSQRPTDKFGSFTEKRSKRYKTAVSN